jgi:hypothetical protein
MAKKPLSFEALMGYLHGAISTMVEPSWKVTGQIWNCCARREALEEGR